jgi:hypothetical protein
MIEVPPDVRVSVVVGHATGVVARACDCELFEAFDRLGQCAVELGQSLEHTALDVLDGVIRFDCDRDDWIRPTF